MKKYISIVLISVMIVSILCSCGNENTTKPESDTQTATVQPPTNPPDTGDSAPDETQAPPAMGGGSQNICQVHHLLSYHSFSPYFEEYIGKEQFEEWYNKVSIPNYESECRYPEATIYKFIKQFNIPREVLEECYFNTSEYYISVWDLDLLYSNDEEAVDNFYRNTEELNEILKKRHCIRRIKWKILDDYYDEWMAEFGSEDVSPTISISDLVGQFDIPREKLEEYARVTKSENYVTYDYNFDAIYGSEGGIKKAPSKEGTSEVKPYEEDMAFCGIDNIYID